MEHMASIACSFEEQAVRGPYFHGTRYPPSQCYTDAHPAFTTKPDFLPRVLNCHKRMAGAFAMSSG